MKNEPTDRQREKLLRILSSTGIWEPYLSALEEGEFNKIPGDVFIRGFLRNYGNYLGLDGNPDCEGLAEAGSKTGDGGGRKGGDSGQAGSCPVFPIPL